MLEITSNDSCGFNSDWCFFIKATINASSTGLICMLAILFDSYCWSFSWRGWMRPRVSNWNWETTSFKVMMSWCCWIKSCLVWVSWLNAWLNSSLVINWLKSSFGSCWMTVINFWCWSSNSCWICKAESVWLWIRLTTSVEVMPGAWIGWEDAMISPTGSGWSAIVVNFL